DLSTYPCLSHLYSRRLPPSFRTLLVQWLSSRLDRRRGVVLKTGEFSEPCAVYWRGVRGSLCPHGRLFLRSCLVFPLPCARRGPLSCQPACPSCFGVSGRPLPPAPNRVPHSPVCRGRPAGGRVRVLPL